MNFSARQREVLIVDDNDYLRGVLRNLLEKKDYRVSLASNGKEALTILEKRPIDLLITDITMPEMNGIQLVRELKRLDRRPLEVVIISSFIDIQELPEDVVEMASVCLNKQDFIKRIMDPQKYPLKFTL